MLRKLGQRDVMITNLSSITSNKFHVLGNQPNRRLYQGVDVVEGHVLPSNCRHHDLVLETSAPVGSRACLARVHASLSGLCPLLPQQ